MRKKLAKTKRWVVKIGSALLTNDGQGLNKSGIANWVGQLAKLRKQGLDIILVSSGSVAVGMRSLGWEQRPSSVHQLQAAAAVGQMGLVQCYESSFQCHGLHTAQVLLTHDDLSDRKRYLNARSAIRELISLGVIPVINENDTVATDEIRFGDNDTLAALVANLVEADALVILTDQQGMFDSDPRQNPSAKLLDQVCVSDESLDAMAGGGGKLGRGGMLTKVRSARLAARSGAVTVVAGGAEPDILLRLLQGESLGTVFVPEQGTMAARKQWLAGHLQTKGRLVLDAGAVKVLQQKGKSLLPVGVKALTGRFVRGEMVACVDESGVEVARGLINYSVDEAQKIIGHASGKIEDILGYGGESEIIHRDNLVLL